MKKTRKIICSVLVVALVLTTFSFIGTTKTEAAKRFRCLGCGTYYTRPVVCRNYGTLTSYSKTKIRREYLYKRITTAYNNDRRTRTLSVSRSLSTTVTWSCSGAISFNALKFGASYTTTSKKSTSNGFSRSVPGKTYVAFYGGHPLDVYNVSKTDTYRCHCCGKTLRTVRSCYQAKVPLKGNRVTYWASKTSGRNSFVSSFTTR